MKKHKRFGEILKKQGKLTGKMIKNALKLQKDNPSRKLGEILITLNYITFDDITDTLRKQYATTGETPEGLDDWLSQEQIDSIVKDMTQESHNRKK